MATNTDEREEIKPVAPTEQTKWRDPSLVGKYMVDPKTGLAGLFRSPDNGETWVLTDTVYGHVYNQDEVDNIWDNGAGHKVADEIKSATADLPNVRKQADEAVKFAESAIAASKVNSDAIVAQSEAISEAKSAMDSATAEIQQTAANAASDAAKIRADVARVQNEVDTAKTANSASVDKLKSDIGLAQKDLDNVHDSLAKAQSAVEQNQKLINDNVAKINSDIAQSRQDIITAQQANDDLAKQLNTYSKEAQEQGKTIKAIQDNQDGFSITIADVKGDVTKVSDTVDGLSAGLKDAQGNIASVKAQADQLNATLTDHSKDIAQLTATAKELSSTLEDADGRLSKVEQTASEQSTTLSDLQGNLTQVKQTADNLVTTLKDAQGNIDQIKQDAKGTLEQLSNAQGDITALQKDVSGIKLTIADHDKNIHTLQADSKTLKDDMADAKGNISSLQKTSTSLVSEFRGHDGRLSKVEQTATEHTSELADTKGNLDKVTQKADNLQLLLSDAQKNIQNIQLDAEGLHDTLTGQSNQLASLNVTLNSLDSKYSGITGDLQSKQTALSTEQQQTKDMLLNKADKSEVDSVKGTVNQVSAEQKLMADQISSKVSAAEYQKDKTDTITAIQKNSTAIDETNKLVSIKANQTDVDNVKGTAQRLSARLDVMAGEVKSKVDETRVNNIVDSKGYATTSTVQSLITQKAGTINESITNLTNEMNTRNGVNLLKGTKDFSGSWHNFGSTNYWHTENWIDPNGNHSVKSDSLSWYGYYQPIYLDTGDYTFSGYYYSEGGKPVFCYIRPNSGDNLVEVSYNSNLDSTPNGWRWFVVHFKVTKAGNAAVRLESGQNQVLHIASYKLERGTVTKPVWTPAPSDNATVTQVQQITASIDGLQSRVTNYQNDTSSKYTQLSDLVQSKVNQGDLNSVRTQLAGAINERVQKGELLSQINLTAGNTLIQSNKLYLDASSVVFSGRAFIPSAAITNIDADKITTGTLNGIDIHQIATKEGRSIDISGGNITLSSSDPYESRLSFKYQGQMVKMFNATGDLEADTWGIFNFSPSDTQNLHPIQFFRINNVGGKGSGSARMQLDHAIFDGHEWWANFDGITFGRSYDGINGSNDYVDLYAKSFLPHSQLSSKTRIEKLNGEDAMNMIKKVQMYTYQFKDDVRDGKTKRYASLIIDDVHDVAQYTEPDIFVADNKKCRDDGTQLAYAIAAIQYQQHEIEELKVQLKEKKANE